MPGSMGAIPVIVGIGEIVDRPVDPAGALEPLALMAAALERANDDADGMIARLDSLDVVRQSSWSYSGTARRLCARLGLNPRRAVYGVTGGESPVRALHAAALRISRGESAVGAVVGAEAHYALVQAQRAGVVLPWTPRAAAIENPLDTATLYNPLAIRHEVVQPADIYPLYEHAAQAAWGQSPAEALAESGALWARCAAVAARNPYAWSRTARDAAAIMTPSTHNRMVAWPYTKRMVANPRVNQGAAVIVASLAAARAAGIAEERLTYFRGGAFASEPRDYLARDQYAHSDAQDLVLRRTLEANGGAADLLELYSCFPIVPKLARRALGLGNDVEPTVTGGLSFFGAPLNNYMTHASCAMVRALRAGAGETGLLYGQGEFVTKHHALMLAREPGEVFAADLQDEVDAARGPVPQLAPAYTGPATIETFTVPFDRDGAPRFAMIVAATPDGRRALARVPGNDAAALARLTAPDRSPIGLRGRIVAGVGGPHRWAFD